MMPPGDEGDPAPPLGASSPPGNPSRDAPESPRILNGTIIRPGPPRRDMDMGSRSQGLAAYAA